MQCQICRTDLKSNRQLLRHISGEHGLIPPQYFKKYPRAEKFCSKCKLSLPISNFLADKSNTYGLRAQCIACMKPGGMTRTCPICGRMLKWSAVVTHMKSEHGIAPIDGYLEYLKEKLCPNCETVKPLDSFSRSQNPEAPISSWCVECNLERNVSRAILDHGFGPIDHLVVRLAFSDRCFGCGLSHDDSLEVFNGPLQVDHMLPHIKGGILAVENAVLLCKKCNLSKGVSLLSEFILKTGATEEELRQREWDLEKRHAWAKREFRRVVMRYARNSKPN